MAPPPTICTRAALKCCRWFLTFLHSPSSWVVERPWDLLSLFLFRICLLRAVVLAAQTAGACSSTGAAQFSVAPDRTRFANGFLHFLHTGPAVRLPFGGSTAWKGLVRCPLCTPPGQAQSPIMQCNALIITVGSDAGPRSRQRGTKWPETQVTSRASPDVVAGDAVKWNLVQRFASRGGSLLSERACRWYHGGMHDAGGSFVSFPLVPLTSRPFLLGYSRSSKCGYCGGGNGGSKSASH
jgi:hypothetical protein